MAQPELTPQLALLEEAMTVLFCRIDDTYYHLNPKGHHYETLKVLSDSEIITLALLEATAGHREPALFPARSRPLLLAPLSWGRRPSPVFIAPSHPQPQALLGTFATRHLARAGWRPGDPDR